MATFGPSSSIRAFLGNQAAGGLVLIAAAASAIILANSSFAGSYEAWKSLKIGPLSLLHWVNDGAMALFFLLVGLEIKRELIVGQLSTPERRRLPLAAAFAGMAVPAIFYIAINAGDPAALRGWAIPAATDIAFALGVLALLGNRVPVSLKLFLTAVAVVDDLGAIAIIALFYADTLNPAALLAAAVGLGVLTICNRRNVTTLWPYLLIGAGVWGAVFQSGVHATLAGVAVALTVPMTKPLERLEHALQPWIAFAVVPLFGFLNAGLDFSGLSPTVAIGGVPIGIAVGLFVGKQVGIFGACRLMVALGLAQLPHGASWRQVYGIALLCGIGFTMSLFIGGLAFGEGSAETDAVKIGVLAGSLLSALLGWLVLRTAPHCAEMPPSTNNSLPVTKRASSDAR